MAKETSYNPPDDALGALARCLYPAMVAHFESEGGRREFAEWKARQDTDGHTENYEGDAA